MLMSIFVRNGWLWRCGVFGIPLVQRRSLESKLVTLKKVRPWATISRCSSLSSTQDSSSNAERKSFLEVIFNRRREANCSVIVEVDSVYVLSHLYSHIEKSSKIKKIFHRRLNSEKDCFLIECENPSDVSLLLKRCIYSETLDPIPAYSRILIFSGVDINKVKSLQIPYETSDAVHESTVNKKLLDMSSITEQMMELQRCEQLSEMDIRLNYFICSQIEDCVSASFPNAICLPFGSAVNGFGCASGDLDMNLNLNGKQKLLKDWAVKNSERDSFAPNPNESLLSFMPKRNLTYDRFQGQRMLETIGDMMQMFVPGISNLLRILKARIPILKFQHDVAKIQCDLTMNNMSGVVMARMLYMYAEMNPCVRPLVHTVRRWARKNELTSDGAGTKITNFSLILMVIFFLQTHSPSLLPPIGRINLSDSTLNPDTTDLEEILKEFLLFCATFNFDQAMCLTTGTTTKKPDYSSLYIHNPIESGLNVSKNVANSELKNFIQAAKNALWQLEKSPEDNGKNEEWGIVKLFKKQKAVPSEELNRRFNISSLFEKKRTDPMALNLSALVKNQAYIEADETNNKHAENRGKLHKRKKKSKG